jgi:hypothetical protein
VDDDPEAAQAAAAFEPGEQVRRELEGFDRHPEHELARVERERFLGADLHFPHDFVDVHAFPEVDVREAAVLEDPESGAEPEVDGAAAQLRVEIDGGRDADLARGQVQSDVTVGENQENPRKSLHHEPCSIVRGNFRTAVRREQAGPLFA